MVRSARILVLLCIGLMLVSAVRVNAETPQEKQKPAAAGLAFSPRERTVEVWGGIAHPLNYASFKRYWMRGPVAGFAMYFRASNESKIGFGAEATLYSFRAGNFTVWNRDVPVQIKDLATLNVFLALRRYFRPTLRSSPWMGIEVGFTRITGAEYKQIVNGVRVTYYEVPSAFRLTATLTTGIDYFLTRKLAVQAEARVTYLHHDENLGLAIGARGGVKFTL
jgi:hypothetical protein